MPMDYDDNDFQSQNLHLAGEGSSTVSPVLRPYALPKFDFDDSLQGHLRFDSLVENEVFLGITSQEDNQWIEEYSRGSSGIEFSSSAAESRRNNVWSEATSSESVEMLLKSVGQEERVVEETITEELEACDEPGSLATTMDPNLEQDDGNDLVINAQKAIVSNELQENFSGFNVSSDREKSHVRFTLQSQDAQISGQELDLVVLGKKCNLPVVEEKVDRICDDANQEEAENLANKLFNNELQEGFSTSKVGCGDMGSPLNFTASSASDLPNRSSSIEAEYSTKSKETSMDYPIGSDTIVKTSTYSAEKPSVVSNVESVVKTSFEVSIPVNEASTGLMPIGNCNLLMTEECKARVFSVEPSQGSQCAVTASPICSEAKQELNDSMHEESLALPPGDGYVKLQATEDGNTKSGILDSPESNVSSTAQVSHMQIRSVEETENTIQRDGQQATSDAFKVSAGNDPSEMGEGSSINDVGPNLTAVGSSAELLAGSNAPKFHSGDSINKDQSLTAKLYGSVQVNDEIQSSEPGAICMDQDVTSNERGDARLPSACSDTDIEVVGVLDSPKNVESTSSAEGCKETIVMAQGSEADMIILAEPFAAVKSDTISSTDTQDGAHLLSGKVATDDIAAKSPLLGVSSMHHDNEKKIEVGFLSEGSSQSGAPQIGSMVDCSSEGALSVVEEGVSPKYVGKVVHGMVSLCAPPVENINAITSEQAAEANPDGVDCSTTSETSPLPCDSSAKVGDNVDSRSLQDPKKSMTGYHGAAPLSLAVDMSDEQQASIDVACPSKCDANHKRQDGDSSASLDKPQHVSPSETNGIELSQSAKDAHEVAKGAMHEKAPLPEGTEDVEGKVQSVSSNSDMRGDKSFTFEVNASAGLGQSGKGLQSIPAIQICNLSTNMEGSSINSSNSLLDPVKSHDVSIASPQTPSIATIQVEGKGNSERKTRRKSAGKESAKKGNRLKEATPRQSGRVEKSSASLTPPATGHVIQFEELKPKENVDCSITKPSSILPISTSNLPDLNNSTSIFQQPFTDNQQVQLRAQILVYGSLISGTPPEEPHMIAAFGQSDGGRKAWEATWLACLERVHGQKSQANNPDPPMQSQSDLKDVGHRTPDPGKHGSLPSKVLSSPIGGASNKGTPSPVVSPLVPLSSPLWNISTPSSVGFPSSGMPRTALHDYRQSLSPLHPYQTPAIQNFAGHNPPWLSQGPFAGQWVASSPVSAFNGGARFSALPITEAVKLTPVKVSVAPGLKHTYSVPVVHSAGPSVFSGVSSLSDAEKATVSSGQASSDSKSRKRKKVAASVVVNRTSVPSQALVASVTAPVVAHLPHVPRMEGHSQISLLAQNRTDSVTAPVVSIFSTSVTVTTPASITSKSSPGRFLSVSSTHDHRKKVETVVGSETLSKVEESKVQAEDAAVHAAAAVKTCQPSSDSKSIKRTKVATSLAVNQTSVPKQASVASVTAPLVAYLPQVFHTEGHSQISLLAQNQTDSVSAPVVGSLFPTSVAVSTPVSIKSSPGRFPSAVYPASTCDYPRTGYQKMEKAVVADETLSKVEESKLQAENAAMLAAAEVSHCQSVWSQLERQKSSGVVSYDEAMLISSAVSIAAAASVAKMAAAAAKIASNVAEQARLMADEVFISSRTGNFDRGSMISHPNVVNKFDKATPASILKTVNRSNHPNSIISAAREAARRRIEAASAASKHAENLDAIVKAAELAAEAVSQAGKIVAMGDPSALRKLVEAGPPGYWKIPHLASDQQGEVSRHLNSSSDKKNVEAAPYVSDKEIQTLKYGLSPQERSGDLAENQMIVIDGISGSIAGHEKDTRIPRSHKGPDLSKTVGVTPETDIGSQHTCVVGQNMPQSTSGAWEEHNIKEGCLVEVYKEDAKYKGAWLAADVLSLKDEKALVCYTEIQSDEEKLKEWVPLEVEGTKVPRVRIAHPMTTIRFEGTRKRRRAAVTDYAWSNGDRVDVWMQDCWREAVVTEPNTIDVTSLTVRFPAQGETLVVRSWSVRPTLTWNDGKWIEWSSLKGGRSTKGETPKEKRMKLGSPAVKDKRKDKSPKNVDLVESGRHEELGTLPLSAQESSFTVGKSTRHENNLNTLRTMRSGLQDGPRVIFGVPKPGKKQKFMDMSKHYVSDGNNKNNMATDSIKFTGYLKQQAPGPRGWKINSRNDAREKQVAETKSRLKSRKPPVPSFRTLAQKDNNLISSKSTTHEAEVTDKSDRDSVSDVENLSGHQNQMEFGSSSNTEDATRGPVSVDAPTKAFSFTSNAKSERSNKGKLATAGGKTAKVEVKDKSIPEVTEPRRSNRRIQPTSRLLEGLQSSLTVSKIPSVSHASQRSHNKVTSKGNTNHG